MCRTPASPGKDEKNGIVISRKVSFI